MLYLMGMLLTGIYTDNILNKCFEVYYFRTEEKFIMVFAGVSQCRIVSAEWDK